MIFGYILNKWVKLNFSYLGESKKKHCIFRARTWNKNQNKILKKSVYNETYTKVGFIKDIFGPITKPFISIKSLETFNPNDPLYTKL